jgi:hypothetical protein
MIDPGIVSHLSLLFWVSRLPAPSWARAAGFGWLSIEIIVGVLGINDVPDSISHPMRLRGHVLAGTWILARLNELTFNANPGRRCHQRNLVGRLFVHQRHPASGSTEPDIASHYRAVRARRNHAKPTVSDKNSPPSTFSSPTAHASDN